MAMRYSQVFSELPRRKSANAAKGLQKNVLRDVRGVAGFRNHSRDQPINGAGVVRHQPVKRRAGAALQLRDQLGFILGPGEDAGQVRHGYRLSCLLAPNVFAGTRAKRSVPCAAGSESRLPGLRTKDPFSHTLLAGKRFMGLDTNKGEWFPHAVIVPL